MVLALVIGAVGGGGYMIAGPVRAWITAAPVALPKAARKLRAVVQPVEQVSRAASQVASSLSLSPISRAANRTLLLMKSTRVALLLRPLRRRHSRQSSRPGGVATPTQGHSAPVSIQA